jgi:shikimate dehydrogenase
MSTSAIRGSTRLAGVVGLPIAHSVSPQLHNAWIEGAGLDAVYVPFCPAEDRFEPFVEGLRGGVLRGLNVTLPFKETALSLADDASALAQPAGAANVLLFHEDGRIEARNTDGDGLLYAFTRQAPDLDLRAAPVAIVGAGGAAKGAVAALHAYGVSDIRVINRTKDRASLLAAGFCSASAWGLDEILNAFDGAGVIVNAASTEVHGGPSLEMDFGTVAKDAVAMDMLYRPLETGFLRNAKAQGLRTVDGLDMLIGQAMPSFEAFFGQAPPSSVDARALLLTAMKEHR